MLSRYFLIFFYFVYKSDGSDRFPYVLFYFKGENLWIYEKLVKDILSFANKLFPSVGYAYTQVPTYGGIGGVICFVICSKDAVSIIYSILIKKLQV